MAYTVIGVFENADVANKALHALVGHGIGREYIDVTTADVNQDNPTGEFPENDSFHNFFRAVFTGHEHDVRDHSEAARRGTTLTIHVRSRQDAEQVQALLDQHGAVNASEYARRYVAQHGGVPLSAHGPAPGPHPDPTVAATQPVTTNTVLRSRIIDRPLDDDERLR
ncbi:hypothetical protein H8B13_00230 [Hymenobacter sp. BT188]|uniref:hypothetical protein n=1 Tax=Hymenobacter sp. BT188 TaxID=2763504 RepID=UPI0016519DAE|nr:hypothetical protein [Hymenobacter sp. BT188]MBC6605235.1 hypothetical protein [Hymenobacter sp. BT188]